MKIYSLLFLAFVAVVFVFPFNAHACACCAERGTYIISTKKPADYELEELKRIKFSTTNLFMTAASPEDIKGISPLSDVFSLNGSLDGNLWKFDVKDQIGNVGTLTLTKPASMVTFMADIHDSKSEGEVSLYKEWRFKYRVQNGTGIFKSGIVPATEYFLVLQGRGNVCTQAEDFTHYRLEVTGKRASYAFFGELK